MAGNSAYFASPGQFSHSSHLVFASSFCNNRAQQDRFRQRFHLAQNASPKTAMTDHRPKNATAVVVLIAAMTLLGAFYLAWPIYRASLPMEIDVNEPWNANWADAAWRRNELPLYPKPGGFLVNNYPPLSFYLIGGIASITGDPVAVGRWLSLLAVAAIAIGTAACVRELHCSRLATTLAGAWTLATFSRFFDNYVGMNDPHLLALAIMVWALAWFIRRQQNGRAVEPAILLMVLAGFFKHNLLTVPIASFMWLATFDRRQAARAAAVGIVAAVVGLMLCGIFFGGDFFRQMFGTPREYSIMRAVNALGRLQWIGPAIVIFLIWRRDVSEDGENRRADSFAMIFIGVAFLLYFVQEMGAGVDDNVQFELVAAAAIGLALAFDRLDVVPIVQRVGVNRGRLAVLLILFVRLLICSRTEPYLLAFSGEFRENLRSQVAVTASETARIAAMPGPVVGFTWRPNFREPNERTREEVIWRAVVLPDGGPKESIIVTPTMLLCRQAGKPFSYDAFAVDQCTRRGQISFAELKRQLSAAGIHFEPVDRRVLIGRN